MKACTKCKKEKSAEFFSKNKRVKDGLYSQCKECCNASQREYRKTSKFKDSQRKYRESGRSREVQRRYNKTDNGKTVKKEYLNSHNGMANVKKHSDKYKSNNPEKLKARGALNRAVLKGKLIRLPCQKCGSINNIEAHHTDYSKSLEVIWLCDKHHKELHIELRAGDRNEN